MANSEEKLHSVVATLEQCRKVLIGDGNRETAHLLSVAVLQLRMKLNKIADAELKALCDAMAQDEAQAEGSQDPKSPHGQRRRSSTVLKLVK